MNEITLEHLESTFKTASDFREEESLKGFFLSPGVDFLNQQCGFLPLLTLVVDAAFTPPVLVQEESLRTLQLWRFSCLEGIWRGELVELKTRKVITDVFHSLPSLPESLDGLAIVLEAANFPREYAVYLASEVI